MDSSDGAIDIGIDNSGGTGLDISISIGLGMGHGHWHGSFLPFPSPLLSYRTVL